MPSPHINSAISSSQSLHDAPWDTFLASSPLGHFQQSSLWAQVKQREGWQPLRAVCRDGDRILGGYQLLFKATRLGRIGYISKGPVLLPPAGDQADSLLTHLRTSLREHRIRALILQPPDRCIVFPPRLKHPPFLPNRILVIIRANCEIGIDTDFAVIEQRMRRHTRQEARQAAKRGVQIRDGTAADLDAFFAFMLASCARQGEHHPNPSRVELLRALWDHFHPAGCLHLHIAEVQGQAVAGILSIRFGSRVTFWKKGASGEHAALHPNHLLQYEAIRWAATQGCAVCDFAAMGPDLAATILNNQPPTAEQKQSRDFFQLGFGGHPVLLPDSRVLIPNPLLRLAYRLRLAIPKRSKHKQPDRAQSPVISHQ